MCKIMFKMKREGTVCGKVQMLKHSDSRLFFLVWSVELPPPGIMEIMCSQQRYQYANVFMGFIIISNASIDGDAGINLHPRRVSPKKVTLSSRDYRNHKSQF